MSLDLSPYSSVQTNVFVRIDIPNYEVLRFSDYHKAYTVNGELYDGLGQLVSISNPQSSLRAAPQDITVVISGIPEDNITDILNNKVKGSAVQMSRAFFDPETGELLNVTGNPAGMFWGAISNYEISDEIEQGESTGTISLVLVCTSVVELLNNKVAGRFTNPVDQKAFYPGDTSMDRVPALARSNFNFGAPE